MLQLIGDTIDLGVDFTEGETREPGEKPSKHRRDR